MAKITFRRVVRVLLVSKVNATLPIVGGACFITGSVFFVPGLEIHDPDFCGTVGAWLFLGGSICYLVAPLVDLFDMSFSINDISDAPPTEASSKYENLYKAQMKRTQRANALLYAVSSLAFVVGSVFFFPSMRYGLDATYGAWTYLMGCVISFLAAGLAACTAHELRKTAEPFQPPHKRLLDLWWWSDEDAHMFSCLLYMLGNLLFAVGSVLFFPIVYDPSTKHDVAEHVQKSSPLLSAASAAVRTSSYHAAALVVQPVVQTQAVNATPGPPPPLPFGGSFVVASDNEYLSETAAVVLFITGSVVFTLGACVDFLVLLRQSSRGGQVNEASGLVAGVK